jgi:hypothetical protein
MVIFAVSLILESQRAQCLLKMLKHLLIMEHWSSSSAGPSDQNMNVVVCDANTPWDTHM